MSLIHLAAAMLLGPWECPCSAQAPAAADDYVIKNWEVEDGLPNNSATAMAQTEDGYIWFGTFAGLVRFDGARFEVLDQTTTPELRGGSVVNMHLDGSGRLWVSTLEGLAVRNGGGWRTIDAEDGWGGDYVRSFAERGDGALLASTFNGRLMEWTDGRFREMPRPTDQRHGAMCAADALGNWWIAQPGYVGMWNGESWTPVMSDPAVRDGVGCAPARDGDVWAIVGAGEIRKYRGTAEVLRLSVADLPSGVWAAFEDSSGYLWISTLDAGVFRVDRDGRCDRWDMDAGLSSNGVRFVFEDRERNLWIGTSGGGLNRFVPRRVHVYGTQDGIAERVVNSLWPAPDGTILVGTYGRGLFRLGPQGAAPIPLVAAGGPVRYIQSVLQDRAGRTWVGTFGDGLFIIDGSGSLAIPPDQTGGGNIIAMFEDSRGRVWVSGGQGVAVIDAGDSRTEGGQPRMALRGVRAFAEDADGSVLMSGREGVFRVRGDALEQLTDPAGQPMHDVFCLRPTPDGVWMGTARTGLLRWRPGRLDAIGAYAGLRTDSVYGIIEDESGEWWMATGKGIVRASRAGLEAVADGRASRVQAQVLGVEDGKEGSECSGGRQPVCGTSPDGRLWFATPKGVAVVDPRGLRINDTAPPVLVERVSFAPDNTPHGKTQSLEGESLGAGLAIPPGSRHIEIRYSGLSYTSPEEVQFEVKLEGLEDSWRSVGNNRSAVFHSLSPGRYVFRVRAANDDGVWNEEGASLAFTMRPHYWQSWWFWAIVGAGSTTGSAGAAWLAAGARFRRRRAKERFQRVVEFAPTSMVVVDAQGKISQVNGQAEREFGYQRSDLIGRPVELLLPDGLPGGRGPPEHDGALRSPIVVGEPRGVRSDGSSFPIELVVSPVQTARGTSTLASITDISERKRTELELAMQRNELAHLSRVTMLGELSGSLAHELNQPLTAILSNAQAAQRHIEREQIDLVEVREILGDIVEQDKRAGEVIRRLRALLQKGESQHQTLNLGDVVFDVLRLMRSDLINHGVEVVSRLDPDLPDVLGDRVQLQQVLMNLLINACDAMGGIPRERRSLEIRTETESGALRVSVIDTGPGFQPDFGDRLFEPFFTTKATGMGLGLAVCRTIIRSHGGEIWAEHNPSGGATFCFSLPAGGTRAPDT